MQVIRLYGVSKLNEKNSSVFVENSEEKLGIGSGIILTSNGYILSNYNTTGGEGESCFVTLKNGNIYPACVKWSDKNLDVSIIKIPVDNLLFLQMGDSGKISIGEKYYMLSNSTGFEFNEILNEIFVSKPKTTIKIVDESNTNYIEDVIKINSDISFANNGGAILSQSGEVLGITSCKINSVIPINRIKNIIEQLKEDEKYQEPYLGVHGYDNDVLKYLVPDYNFKLGIYIEKIEEDSALYEEMILGDILVKIDDYELSTFEELYEYLGKKNIGEKVKLSVIRGKKELFFDVILKRKPR